MTVYSFLRGAKIGLVCIYRIKDEVMVLDAVGMVKGVVGCEDVCKRSPVGCKDQ